MDDNQEQSFSLSRAYDPSQVEDKWYQYWLEQGYFKPKINPAKKPFVIIMPPPNVTGELHLGHALPATLEDIMIRWHRMKGDPTLWLPGIDHAGIAAQVVVERDLAKRGQTRQQLGREKFLEHMWDWMRKYGRIIAEQHKKLGTSCDWSREMFTLDPAPSAAVRTTFVRLYRKGLIYRGRRIINWCPRCLTALSDLEVEHQETSGNLYYVKYPLADGSGHIIVATTRPETILGDTAVAVNPDDERYTSVMGKKIVLPVVERTIPIVSDSAVDISFGTGAVKITPFHDPADFEVAQRHGLPGIMIMNDNGTMNENAGPFAGQDRNQCRRAIMDYLTQKGLVEKIEPHKHAVGHCQRCGTVIEPFASHQWFVKTQPLAKPALEAVQSGRIKIWPEHFVKIYVNWMENIRDWCISRQLWWGHRIPVWYCDDCQGLTVTIKDPTSCSKCHSTRINQDPDVLDTWFSSALWPHSTMGWPRKTRDLKYFYPTSVMETGYDILFFWVARMVMMGLENTGVEPFKHIYLHGLIRDERGEKMSKVKGNVLNPLELIKQYGADALRFAVSTGTAPGNDIKLSASRLEAGRNFANKLWNATRYILTSLEGVSMDLSVRSADLPDEDVWILARLDALIRETARLMESFEFGEAEKEIYEFLWNDLCDWYIEISKIRLRQGDKSPLPVLASAMDASLRLLHPFMPFVTEELWGKLNEKTEFHSSPSIMLAPYPEAGAFARNGATERMEVLKEVVRSIRNARANFRIDPAAWLEARIYYSEPVSYLRTKEHIIQTLAKTRPLTFHDNKSYNRQDGLTLVLKDLDIVIPLKGVIDLEAEQERTRKEIARYKEDINRIQAKLSNDSFLQKAPEEVVEKEKRRLEDALPLLKKLEEQLSIIERSK